jgi:DUF1680 family protein
MYITGGIGSTHHMESFTIDYDLPNDTAYAETCASVAMVFFARRMLEAEPNGKYADIMELELYNGVLSGMQLNGKKFFYVNPLEVVPGVSGELYGYKHVLPRRPKWYGCACCPPNVARLIMSLNNYAWSENKNCAFNHLYMGGSIELNLSGGVRIECASGYPWKNSIHYSVYPKSNGAEFTLAVRVPAWSREYSVNINGEPFAANFKDGYAYITRRWNTAEKIILTICVEPRRVYANTKVRANAGCIAIMRGPLVYCFEECDNGEDLSALRLPRSSPLVSEETEALNVISVKAEGFRTESGSELYSDTPPVKKDVSLRAVPYFAWGNREQGGMRVWLLEEN